jgi:prophage regulatory protein
MNTTQIPVLLTVQDVRAITGFSRKFIYREEAAGRFPKPVKLGTRWIAAEIHAWIAAKAQARDQVTGG